MAKSVIIDANGKNQEVQLDVSMYKAAGEQGMNFVQYLNRMVPTNAAKDGTAFEQVCAQEGIFVKGNKELGIAPSKMADILEGRPRVEAGVTVKESNPVSRLIFPAVVLSAVESKLVGDLMQNSNGLDEMIGYEENINGDRYEYPVLDFTKPEAARSQRIAQLAQPASMMTITVSDTAKRIPTYSIGLEISEQALRATSIDFVALSIARQAAIEKNERAVDALLAIWNGDLDNGDDSLASLSQVKTTASYDATATTTVTQKAWIKFLMQNAPKSGVTHVVTDVETALKIEARTGRPTISGDDPKSPRIDTLFSVVNPQWPTNVRMFLMPESSAWPADSMMSLDKNYSLRRVTSLTASYNAIESFVLRRSTAMRMDFGWEIHRMFGDSVNGMVISA